MLVKFEKESVLELKDILEYFVKELLKDNTSGSIKRITYNHDTEEMTIYEEIEKELD